MKGKVDILVAGVGGQGIILATEIISEAALLSGYDAKKADVHGMAQRGGSVVSTVRFSKKVYSPLIKYGDADVLLGFELLEGFRNINYVKRDGFVIVNTQKINPIGVASGREKYPDFIEDKFKEWGEQAMLIDAFDIAKGLGDTRTVNTIMIGALSKLLDIEEDIWKKAIEKYIKPKYLELNIRAFEMGREVVKK
ncbi:MAG: indolepyruvate oxidoreductase subunit beta [bacterium]